MKKFFNLIFICIFLFCITSCNNQTEKIEVAQNKNLNDEIKKEETENIEIEEETKTTIKEAHEILSPMNVTSIAGYRDTDKSTYIEIVFSKNIADKFDPASYIKIEPDVSFNTSKVDNKFILKGDFNPKDTYEVKVLSGIRAYDGVVSKDDQSEKIYFDQKKPKILFSNEGIILPSIYDKKVYIRSLNVNKVNIVVNKIYLNNTTQLLQNFNFSGNGNSYWYDFDSIGDKLYDVKYDIENEIDTWVQTAIDLTGIIDANGIYTIDVSFDKDGTSYKFPSSNDEWYIEDYFYTNGRISKTILLTNIGIMAQKNDDGINVNVLDIVENKSLRGVKVYLISRNNQILQEKTTNTDGVVKFDNFKNSFYILAEDTSSKSILPLKSTLSLNGFNTDGAFVTSGINGFIYTERGVYRPGDPVYLSIIARNNNMPLENNQPIKITIYDPTGSKMIDNDIIKEGKNGFYTYSFKTETSARTGIWKLEATIGNQVFTKDISIEAVVPNRIKVDLNIPDVVNVNDSTDNFNITANYLFGEPAGNLKYTVDFSIREEPIDFPNYKDYTFTAPSSYTYVDGIFDNGTLDNKGYAKIKTSFDKVKFQSLNMHVVASGRVIEDGGRNVTTRKYFKYKKFDTYIGIEKTNTYKKPGSPINLKTICISEDGDHLVAGKKLKYRIYGNNYYWWWDYSDYNSFIRSFKSDKNTILMDEGEFVSRDVPYLLSNELPNAEYLYVEIEDLSTGQIVGVNLQSSEWVDPSVTKKIETLNIITDKKKYSVGDFAKIKYKGTKSSKAIITIEKHGKIIDQLFRDVESDEMIEQIRITKDMAPNIYVYISLIQDYKTKENDRPLRLYGVVPVAVEDDDSKIDLEIDAPEQIMPNEKFTVKIKNKKNKQFDYTIAVVDEGLLDITQFKTPDPFSFFFKKLAAKIGIYDNYSEIIDRPYGAINQILKVGGDEAILNEMARRKRLKDLGLEEADRFKPVSLFKGVLTTDGRGEATVDFDMPNYMGSVRIMVVATNKDSFGSCEKNMLVKAPIIIEPTIPRSMKINDKLSIPITIFALEENIGNIEVYYKFKNNNQNKNLNMSKGEKQIIYFDESIDNEIGSFDLTIGVKSKVYNYEQTVKMAINSNTPAIDISENREIKGKNQVEFIQNNEFIKGTVDSVLTISNSIVLGIDQRLKYLIKYPYGCAEQTTSSVLPQLFIDKLSTKKNYDKERVINNINAGIARLKLFQLSNGSFSYWPGDNYTSDFATNYIGHFLVLAKQNGYYVPDSMYNNWLEYTEKTVRGTNINSQYVMDYKCYALYLLSLANKPNISEMNYMYENYFNKDMNLTSKMYLAASYKLSGQEKIAMDIASKINTTSIKKMFDEIYSRDRYYYNYSYGSKLREIAVYLNCYFTIYGKRDEEAFNEILNSLREKNWYSTQTTAYSLIALSNIVSNNINENISGVVEIDGVKTEYSFSGVHRIILDENVKNIKVISNTDGMTFVNYFWEGVLINSHVDDYSKGFTIDRKFYDNNGNSIDETNLNSGDTFWLEITINPTRENTLNIENIALTQILPSGWEIENLRITNSKPPKWVDDIQSKTTISYTDIRDDRIMWFFNKNKNSDYKFFVKLNAVTKGEFDFPGTQLEAMYDNDYIAFKNGKRVKVK